MSKEFQPDNNGDMFVSKSNIIKKNVLKNKSINVVSSKKIESQSLHIESTRTKVSPIKNNDEIIGVMTECTCGEVIKIYFNYESENTPG